MRHVAVIGGGAAGMMAAITAAREGVKVTILEHKDRIGKRFYQPEMGVVILQILIRHLHVIVQIIEILHGISFKNLM